MSCQILKIIAPVFFIGLSACLPTAPLPDPAPAYSPEQISALTGLTAADLRNEGQCSRSAAIMADPTSTANERYGATAAGKANGCPGF